MKKMFFLVLLLFALTLCFAATAETANPNDTFTASFTVLDNPQDAVSATVSLQYDTAALVLVDFEGNASASINMQDNTGIDAGKTITAVFTVKPGAPAGNKTITATASNTKNKKGTAVSALRLSDYSITVSGSASTNLKSWPKHEVMMGEAFIGWFTKNQDIYSGPGVNYYRAADGKAEYGSPEDLEIYGKEGNWILVCYWFGGSQRRMGYVLPNNDARLIKPWDWDIPVLSFAYANAVISKDCVLTDDPFRSMRMVSALDENTKVTYLATLPEGHSDIDRNWAYVEVETEVMINQQRRTVLTRGFVPMDCVLFEH